MKMLNGALINALISLFAWKKMNGKRLETWKIETNKPSDGEKWAVKIYNIYFCQ